MVNVREARAAQWVAAGWLGLAMVGCGGGGGSSGASMSVSPPSVGQQALTGGRSVTALLSVTPPAWNPPLTTSIDYGGGPSGWLSATPASGGFQLNFDDGQLAVGSYSATLTVSGDSRTQPVQVPVTLAVSNPVGLTHAPMIGATTSSGTTVWMRADGAATATVAWQAVGSSTPTTTTPQTLASTSDFTARFPIAGLAPATEYQYQVRITQVDGSETDSGVAYFRTPAATAAATTFVVLSDFMNNDTAAPTLVAATTPRPDFVAIIGDMDHRGPAIDHSTGDFYPAQDAPVVLENMRQMRRDMRDAKTAIGGEIFSALVDCPDAAHPQIPLYNVWDDHDYCANNADATCPFVTEALQAWGEFFVPAADNGFADAGSCGERGVWQRLPLGGSGELFMLDSRSQRDETGGTTMLGDCQKAWLLDGLQNSTATWKIILSPVTLNPGTKSWDGWGHFPSEHDSIVSFVQAHAITHVVVLSGDIHSGGAVDDGSHSGLPEISIPHANMPADWVDTYCHLQQGTLYSEPGTWTIGGLVDPHIGVKPHNCLGQDYPNLPTGPLPPVPYPLAGGNASGYVSVHLTAQGATFQVMDANGHLRSGYRADGSSAPLQLTLTAP
jgi:alkaline phosphatase D